MCMCVGFYGSGSYLTVPVKYAFLWLIYSCGILRGNETCDNLISIFIICSML